MADFEGRARRILAHCGLDRGPACLSFYETERVVLTASLGEVRRPGGIPQLGWPLAPRRGAAATAARRARRRSRP